MQVNERLSVITARIFFRIFQVGPDYIFSPKNSWNMTNLILKRVYCLFVLLRWSSVSVGIWCLPCVVKFEVIFLGVPLDCYVLLHEGVTATNIQQGFKPCLLRNKIEYIFIAPQSGTFSQSSDSLDSFLNRTSRFVKKLKITSDLYLLKITFH